jgi:excisionase family DNA binding protein
MPAVLLTYQDAAARLAVSVSTVRRLVAAGTLPCVRIGASVRVSESALDRFIQRAAGELMPPPQAVTPKASARGDWWEQPDPLAGLDSDRAEGVHGGK